MCLDPASHGSIKKQQLFWWSQLLCYERVLFEKLETCYHAGPSPGVSEVFWLVLFQISHCSGWSSIPSLDVNESDTDVCDFLFFFVSDWTVNERKSKHEVWKFCQHDSIVEAVVKSKGGWGVSRPW